MIYALLTTISAVHPTATPIPTPTASPAPMFVSIVDAPGIWEMVGILSSVVLGVVALVISINAYNFAKKQQQREEEMRKREAKIAVMDKAFEIYDFFTNGLLSFHFTSNDQTKLRNELKLNEIRYKARMIFNKETFTEINKLTYLISDAMEKEKMDEDEYIKYAEKNGFGGIAKAMTDGTGTDYRLMALFTYSVTQINKIFEKFGLNI